MPRRKGGRATPQRTGGLTHPCFWPKCETRIGPESRLACTTHWVFIPHQMRTRLNAAWEPGQTPANATGEYAAVLAEIEEYANRRARSLQGAGAQ